MPVRSCAVLVVLLISMSPSAARADWILTPHFGTTFGADATNRHAVLGGAIAEFDEDAFGWEADISFVPDFFAGRYGSEDFTSSNSSVLSLMANALIGVPVGGRHRDRIRPYVTLGAGVMQMFVASPEDGKFFETFTYEPGWNAGIGGLGFITKRIGIRADVRYIRSFRNQRPSWTRGLVSDVAPGNFDFFRGTVGLTVRVGPVD